MSTLELEHLIAGDDWDLGATNFTHDDPVDAGLDMLSLPGQRDNQDDVMGESMPPVSASTDDALSGANAPGSAPLPASALPMPSGVSHVASAHSELFSQLADVLPDPALVDMVAPLGAGTGGISLRVPVGGTSVPPRPRKTAEHPNAVNRHKIACHHPPYRITHCDGVLHDGLENLQGSGKSRVAFLCHKCLAAGKTEEEAKFSQLIFKNDGDPDPKIRKSQKLSRKERAMPFARVRSGHYKCGKCRQQKVYKAELDELGVVFCKCPPCPICHPRTCKCHKDLTILGNSLLPSLPDMPALAPVAPRSMMVGGGSELSGSGQTIPASAIASAQNAIVIAQAISRKPAKIVVASAKPLLAQTVGATEPASASKQDPPASSNAETVAPPKPAGAVRLPTSVVPGSFRAIYGGKPKRSVPSDDKSESDAAEDDEGDDAADGQDEPKRSVPSDDKSESDAAEDDEGDDAADGQDEPSKDNATASAFRMVEGVCMPSNDDDAEEPSPAPTPSAEPTAVARPVPLRKRKAMKPIANIRLTKAASIPCEVCSKPGSSIRCKHKKCSARVCSAICGGYLNDANMNWAGGWACSQHMASPDDHAWFCPSCSKMVTDRTDNDEIGVIIKSIGCDKCNGWYCLECVGLHKRKRLPDTWYCGKC